MSRLQWLAYYKKNAGDAVSCCNIELSDLSLARITFKWYQVSFILNAANAMQKLICAGFIHTERLYSDRI